MDLSKIRPNAAALRLKNPAGAYIGVTLMIMPTSDERFKVLEFKIRNKAQSLNVRGKFIEAEEGERNKYDLYAATVIGWKWEIGPDGEQTEWKGDANPPYSPKLVAEFLRECDGNALELGKQIEEQIGNTADFFKV